MEVHSEFYKNHPGDKIWWVRHYMEDENGVRFPVVGYNDFTFDRKNIFSWWRDYLDALTPEQKATFDKDNPYWADCRKDIKDDLE